MHILISNDDGYRAPGIHALARVMRRFGRVTIVAPDHNHSGASNSLTLNRPLTVEHMPGESLYVVSGTPSDCVHVALTGLLEDRPDLVVSGINCGANMGDDTMYSGTVAAAIEGHLFGIPSIAFSQIDKGWSELEAAAEVAAAVVDRFAEPAIAAKEPMLLNVNIPNMPRAALKGIVATRLGRRSSAEPVIREMSPRGFPIYWLGAAGKPSDASEGTDFWATSHGFVSVTPLQTDLTNHRQVALAGEWLNSDGVPDVLSE
ncbi:5'/3'-nucleotidase SurE [Sutterella sp.]|uniref:5'/3'-nucleotidase SurE n=1 Tax=Sutterella sp. TaxID=1981025 RepID=UPI0026DEAC44|nr:5'/3'-nucleotidase SurE [Sutterella sp.]MDO5530551.1 5'/3'-nucleotidase SurE [Sutterella sp.]